jgi:hypothetical protein
MKKKDSKTHVEQPAWVCIDCGMKYGRRITPNHLATFHIGRCEVCGETKPVTEPRDFGYLNAWF